MNKSELRRRALLVVARMIKEGLWRAEVDERDALSDEDVRAIEIELEAMAEAFAHTHSYAVTFYDDEGRAILQDSFTRKEEAPQVTEPPPVVAPKRVLNMAEGIPRTSPVAVVGESIKTRAAPAQSRVVVKKLKPKIRTITGRRKV